MPQFDAVSEPDDSGDRNSGDTNSDDRKPSRRDGGGQSDLPSRDGAFLGIQFDCCGVYGRIYRDRNFRCYSGRCPRCMRRIEVPIGEGGSGGRFFRAN